MLCPYMHTYMSIYICRECMLSGLRDFHSYFIPAQIKLYINTIQAKNITNAWLFCIPRELKIEFLQQ